MTTKCGKVTVALVMSAYTLWDKLLKEIRNTSCLKKFKHHVLDIIKSGLFIIIKKANMALDMIIQYIRA